MSTLKQRFAELQLERPAISQADLARATGAKPPSVNAWFTGETKSMKPGTAAKAAALYDVNPIWLATGEGWKNSPIYKQNNPLALIEQAPAATNDVATLGRTLAALAQHLKAMDEATRRKALLLISDLGTDPDSHATVTAMIELSILSRAQKAA